MKEVEQVPPGDLGADAVERVVRASLAAQQGLAVLVFDAGLRVVATFGGALARHGYSGQAMVGRTLARLTPPEEWAFLSPLYARALCGETVAFELPSADGTAVYATTVTPAFEGGQIVGATAVSRDVTAERSREESTRRAVARFERMFTAAPVGMLLVSGRRIERANTAIADLIGVPGADLVGRDPVDFVHPGDVTAAARSWEQIAVGEVPGPQDRRVRTPDGRTLHLRLRHSILSEDGETPPLALVHLVDRTAEVEAEIAREAALKLFETTVDEAPIGMCLVGTDGRFMRVNAALCRLLERDEATLLAADFQSLTHPDDLEADLALLHETLGGGRDSYELDKRYLTPGGEVIHAALSVTLVRHPNGTPAHFISQVVDLTERKLLEQQLRHLADHDALTGLYTRRRFADELRREAARTARHRRAGCLLMVDLDGFKEVNDRFGHRAGDEMLRLLGAALRGTLRAGDVLARIGGDEFAAILPDTDLFTGQLVAQRLLEAVRTHGRLDDGLWKVCVTASIGLTVVDADVPAGIEHLLAEADAAMYRVKTTGKDGACWFPGGLCGEGPPAAAEPLSRAR